MGWLDERHLVTFEAQSYSRLTVWEVGTESKHVYKISGYKAIALDLRRMIAAEQSEERPYVGRAVEVKDARTGQRLARLHRG